MIELRPLWCHAQDSAPSGLDLGPWKVAGTDATLGSDGAADQWDPAHVLDLYRLVSVDVETLRNELGISDDEPVTLATSWYCQASANGGNGSVQATGTSGPIMLSLSIMGAVSGSVRLETAVLVEDPDLDGSSRLAWSDRWDSSAETRSATTIQLEGDQDRWPVVTVDFTTRFPHAARHALWHVDVRTDAELHEPFSSAVTLLLNMPAVENVHGSIGEIPELLIGAMRTDVLAAAATAFLPYLGTESPPEGSVAWVLHIVISRMALSHDEAVAMLEHQPEQFSTHLRSQFWSWS